MHYKLISTVSISQYHSRGACFRLYNDFLSFSTLLAILLSPVSQSYPFGISIYISSLRVGFRKAVLTSKWSTSQSRVAASAISDQKVVSFATGAKVLS